MRTAAKVDANQHAIVQALRKAGASVTILSAVGHGCPDLLVGYRHQNYLFEVKPATPRVARFTADEETWTRGWRGQMAVVRSWQDAMSRLDMSDWLDITHPDWRSDPR